MSEQFGTETEITKQQIEQKASELLDRWKGSPGGPPPERRGDIIKAYMTYGNEGAGITEDRLREWYPGYSKEKLRELGEEIIRQAQERDRKEGGTDWEYITE